MRNLFIDWQISAFAGMTGLTGILRHIVGHSYKIYLTLLGFYILIEYLLLIKIVININTVEFSLIENESVFCSFAYHLQAV